MTLTIYQIGWLAPEGANQLSGMEVDTYSSEWSQSRPVCAGERVAQSHSFDNAFTELVSSYLALKVDYKIV